MSDDDDTRKDVLQQVVSLAVPAKDAQAALSRFPWNWDSDDLVQMHRDDALRVLYEMERGHLRLADASEWAEALDAREDLGFEPRFHDELRQFVFELSSPEISYAGTPEWVRGWVDRLRRM